MVNEFPVLLGSKKKKGLRRCNKNRKIELKNILIYG